MLYAFVRPLAKIGISIFFRRIYLTQTENIPENKPVILACNHPTAFLEPCILACFLDRPLYYLVRGDYFNKPMYNFLLRALHMLPVYRRHDGDYSKLKDNFATLEASFDILKKKKTLMIFPEGRTLMEYRLRSLHKGIGRIVMGTFEKYPGIEELYIVPVGVNYTDPFRFRSDVMIEFGEPIKARTYWEKYREHPNAGVMKVLEDLSPAMKKEMIIIAEPKRDILTKAFLEMDRSRRDDGLWPVVKKDPAPLRAEQAVAQAINALPEDQLEPLQKQVEQYQIQLSRHGLMDSTLLEGKTGLGPLRLQLVLLAFPAFLGYWMNYPFVNTVRNVVRKKVKRLEYTSPVLVGGSIGIYLALIIVIVLISLFTGFWWLLLSIPLLFFTGIAYIAFDHYRERYRQERKCRKVKEERQEALLRMRAELLRNLLK